MAMCSAQNAPRGVTEGRQTHRLAAEDGSREKEKEKEKEKERGRGGGRDSSRILKTKWPRRLVTLDPGGVNAPGENIAPCCI